MRSSSPWTYALVSGALGVRTPGSLGVADPEAAAGSSAGAVAAGMGGKSDCRSARVGLKNMVVMYYPAVSPGCASTIRERTFLRYLVVVPTPNVPFLIALAVR